MNQGILELFVMFCFFSGQIRADQVQAAEQRAEQDLEAVGLRPGRLPGRGGVCARDAPHQRQDGRQRAADHAAGPSRATVQAERRGGIRDSQVMLLLLDFSSGELRDNLTVFDDAPNFVFDDDDFRPLILTHIFMIIVAF